MTTMNGSDEIKVKFIVNWPWAAAGEENHSTLHPMVRMNSCAIHSSSAQSFERMEGWSRDAPVHALEG